MGDSRLTKLIFNFINNKKSGINWFQVTDKNLLEEVITQNIISDGQKLLEADFQEKKRPTNVKWSEERKKAQSKRMKAYWLDLCFAIL